MVAVALPNAETNWAAFAIWGGLGGVVVLGLEFWSDIRRSGGKLPAKYRRPAYWAGESVRIAVGAIVAGALGGSGQVTVPIGALTAGIAAPLLVARLSQQIPRLEA
jgi:hypothetical protein